MLAVGGIAGTSRPEKGEVINYFEEVSMTVSSTHFAGAYPVPPVF